MKDKAVTHNQKSTDELDRSLVFILLLTEYPADVFTNYLSLDDLSSLARVNRELNNTIKHIVPYQQRIPAQQRVIERLEFTTSLIHATIPLQIVLRTLPSTLFWSNVLPQVADTSYLLIGISSILFALHIALISESIYKEFYSNKPHRINLAHLILHFKPDASILRGIMRPNIDYAIRLAMWVFLVPFICYEGMMYTALIRVLSLFFTKQCQELFTDLKLLERDALHKNQQHYATINELFDGFATIDALKPAGHAFSAYALSQL